MLFLPCAHSASHIHNSKLSPTKQGILTQILNEEESYLAVDNSLGEVELADHAKWDGSTAWLGVVKLTLEKESVDILLRGEDLSGASSSWSSPDNGDVVFHVQRRGGLDGIFRDLGLSHESRRGEGGSRSGETSNSDRGRELHYVWQDMKTFGRIEKI
jgi:hypothetical protein